TKEATRLEEEKNGLEIERARKHSRVEFLLDRERDLEELSAGARKVIEGVASGAGPCAPEELLGLVADHLRTDTRHARALDAVLGVRAGALVARDREAAARVAAWLKADEAGQVGLVMPGGLAHREAVPVPAGSEGPLAAHVRASEKCSPLAALLTRGV